jgi:hypothetical protein
MHSGAFDFYTAVMTSSHLSGTAMQVNNVNCENEKDFSEAHPSGFVSFHDTHDTSSNVFSYHDD